MKEMLRRNYLIVALLVVIVFITTNCYAVKVETKVDEVKYGGATLKVSSDTAMYGVKVYKKAQNGKYILIAKVNAEGKKEIDLKISRNHLSTTEKTEIIIVSEDENGNQQGSSKITVDEVPKPTEMNPEETAKPTTTEWVIPTKPTPTTTTTSSANPTSSSSPSGTSQPTTSGGGPTVTLDQSSMTLKVGETKKLTAKFEGATGKIQYTWSTSDKNVAKIDKDGNVTGIKKGEVTITAKIKSNGNSASCKVTVVDEATKNNTTEQGDTSYNDHMKKKLEHYGSSTDYGCLVDCDKCKVTIFKKVNGNWQLEKQFETFQGVNKPWTDYETGGAKFNDKLNWSGPRSRSFKGAWKVVGKWKDSNNLGFDNLAVCYVPSNHEGGASGNDDCQRFEFTGYGDPESTPLEKRYKTLGCCGLSKANAQWIYDNIPVGTTVVVFDKYNPMPAWNAWDAKASVSSPLSTDV